MTTPYTAGAASVTAGNPVVTGIGTAWQTALIPGGMFGLDSANGNPVPILSIDSDTQLTLALPWRGSSASGQAYWIVRDTAPGQQTVANASALAQIIADLRSEVLAALAGLTPEANTLPVFRSGGIADLVGLDDLVYELGISEFSQGLLAVMNAADFLEGLGVSDFVRSILDDPNGSTVLQSLGISDFARTLLDDADAASVYGTLGQIPNAQVRADLTPDKAFRRGNLIGTVSRSGGVPTGALLERGSNANGEYIKFADGTQICWLNDITATYTNSSAISSTWTFPASFAGVAPSVMICGVALSSTAAPPTARNGIFGAAANLIDTSVGAISNAQYSSSDTIRMRVTAIGRWSA